METAEIAGLIGHLNKYVPAVELTGVICLVLSAFIKLSRDTLALVTEFIDCRGKVLEVIKRKRGRRK